MIDSEAMCSKNLLSIDKSTFRTPLRAGCLLLGMLAMIAPAHAIVTSVGAEYVVSGTRIEVFDSGGAFLLQFGGTGTGPGQFQLPSGITVDNTGNVWVTDAIQIGRAHV